MSGNLLYKNVVVLYAGIVVEAPLTKIFHYRVPESLNDQVKVGSTVLVPFGPRKIRGVCIELNNSCPIDPAKARDLISCCPSDETIPEELLRLTKWVGGYYGSSWGNVLAAAVPTGVRDGKQGQVLRMLKLTVSIADARIEAGSLRKKRAKRQAEVLQELIEAGGGPVPASALSCDASSAVVNPLEKKGLLQIETVAASNGPMTLAASTRKITLTNEQQTAVDALVSALDQKEFSSFLLRGITGSGKTEVYLQAMSYALSQGRGVLVLVPEISLTPQTVGRFQARVGQVAVMHSHMTDGERADVWRAVRKGDVRVVVGARSAVFAPVVDLGLIIVDEEHERTFKQDNDPRYHGRDIAVVRAKESGAILVLGSATPSLESWHNAQDGKYTLLSLTERPGGAVPPQVSVVNMRNEWSEQKQQAVFSRELLKALELCLLRQEQAILFLNRRGFHTSLFCTDCGEPVTCDACEIPMTYHKMQNQLRCHYCDKQMLPPKSCAECGGQSMKFMGTGTERAEDILQSLLPKARILRMDSDTMSGRDAHAMALSAFARGEYDFLLGTQMVTKGFDFPNVTLVGVLSADTSINLPDFRSAERSFQLVTQVIGRAGRSDKTGRAIIQAFQPDHFAIQCAVNQDFLTFAEKELASRRIMKYPPFGRMARILARGEDEAAVRHDLSEAAARMREHAKPLAVLGPAPCFMTKIQHEYRYHILLKEDDPTALKRVLRQADIVPGEYRGVRITVDIDPVSLL